MRGLTVRWSLTQAPEGIDQTLMDYLRDSSHARFTGKDGLGFKVWRKRSQEWFEGCYVFADEAERTLFQESFTAAAADSPVSRLVGSAPILIEPCEVMAIAEGAGGFASYVG